MGVIERQSIKGTMISYLGVIVGLISVLFIYPLQDEWYGLAQFLLSAAMLLYPILSLGSTSLINRFWSDPRDHQMTQAQFRSRILLLGGISFMITLPLLYLFREPIYRMMTSVGYDADLLRRYAPLITGLSIAYFLAASITLFINTLQRIVIPRLILVVGLKFYLPAIFLLLVYQLIDLRLFTYLLPFFYIAGSILLLAYMRRLIGREKLLAPISMRTIPWRRYIPFMGVGSLQMSSMTMLFRIDSVMISGLLGLVSNGIYTKLLLIANTIFLPTASMLEISNPIISAAIQKESWPEVQDLYRKAAYNLLSVGIFIALGLWYGLPHLIALSGRPESFGEWRMIFILLAVAKLVDMTCSMANSILQYSRLYYMNLLLIVGMATVNITSNIYFIHRYGMVGAAMATALSLCLFNVLRVVYVAIQFKVSPVSLRLVKILLLAAGVFFIMRYIPSPDSPILALLVQSIALCIVYWIPHISLRLSPELSATALKMWKNIVS